MSSKKLSRGRVLPRGRRLLLGVVLLALAAGMVAAVALREDGGLPRFGVVRQGRLYRSGQPDQKGWALAAREYHIRTIVDVREDDPSAEWAQAEKDACVRYGMRHVKLTIDRVPTPGQLQEFLCLAEDPENWPILVHCEQGRARTGVLIAAYRMLAQGWTAEDAIADYQLYKDKVSGEVESFLRNLRPLRAKQKASSPAEQ